MIKRVAAMPSTVLLQGESGVGKELFARAMHDSGPRRGKPFVAVNCAALPENLIEAELFGYTPGAFTGARREGAPGRIREADGGTLFLDEIGDMPLPLQGAARPAAGTTAGRRPTDSGGLCLVCATPAAESKWKPDVSAPTFTTASTA
jgi:Mg-chelatase subunit ChlI